MAQPVDGTGTDDPNIGGGTGPTSNPSNTGSWQTLIQYTLNTALNCRVQVNANFKLSYGQSGVGWAAELWIDGNVVDRVWAGTALDKVAMLGSAYVASGARDIRLLWQGGSGNLVVYNPRMAVTWSYK